MHSGWKLEGMKRYITILAHFFKLSLARAIAYKENFITWTLVTIGWTALMVVFYEVLFLNTNTIAGWTKAQVLLLQGFYFMIEFFMWGILWDNMRELPIKINSGAMDLELTKPINHQFLLSFKTISFNNINNFILGLGTVLYAVKSGGLTITVSSMVMSVVGLCASCLFIYAGWFTTMCWAFWADRFENLYYLFPSLRQFWRMPEAFYTGVLRKIVSFVFPIGLITSVPAEFLLGRGSWLFLSVLTIFACGLLWLSRVVFATAVRHYGSASS